MQAGSTPAAPTIPFQTTAADDYHGREETIP